MKTTYIHDTHTIYASHGELHLINENHEVIFNMQNLFNDLPAIIEYCLKDHDENKKNILESIAKLSKK